MSVPAHWPRGDPDALARAITAQPAYRVAPAESNAAGAQSLWDAFWSFIGHVLEPLAHWIHGVSSGGKPLGLVLSYALFALVLAGLIYLVVRIVDALSTASASERGARSAREGALIAARSAAEWRASAEAAAARGDYAAAVVALFSAALASLDERALVPFDRARTPGEYRRALRRGAAWAAEPFDVLADAFVRAAFAGRPVSRDDYARAAAAYDGMQPRAA